MKRKPLPIPETVIDEKLLEEAKRAIQADQMKGLGKCSVCGAACTPTSVEALCWVCRRLKISAWRDSDQQIAQE
jgi:hypothetical protein